MTKTKITIHNDKIDKKKMQKLTKMTKNEKVTKMTKLTKIDNNDKNWEKLGKSSSQPTTTSRTTERHARGQKINGGKILTIFNLQRTHAWFIQTQN